MLLSLLSRETITVRDLERIYLSRSRTDAFLPALLSALRQLDPEATSRATWLLLRYARDHGLAEAIVGTLVEEASGLSPWTTRLNLCQLLAHTGTPAAARAAAFAFLSTCSTDRHAIVRAWAYAALHRFADDPEFRSEISRILQRARSEPAKSIQARLRQLPREDRARRRGSRRPSLPKT